MSSSGFQEVNHADLYGQKEAGKGRKARVTIDLKE